MDARRDRTPYEILGVGPQDHPDIIRRAWRALVRSYHPDQAREDPQGASQRLAEINAAFDAIWSHGADQRGRPRGDDRDGGMRQAVRRRHAAAQEAARRSEERIRAQAARFARRRDGEAQAGDAQTRRPDRTETPGRAVMVVTAPWDDPARIADRAAHAAFCRALDVLNGARSATRRTAYL